MGAAAAALVDATAQAEVAVAALGLKAKKAKAPVAAEVAEGPMEAVWIMPGRDPVGRLRTRLAEVEVRFAPSQLRRFFDHLKRQDEKAVTERAYENPVFVEDLVRNVALRLNAHPDVTWYRVEAENYESIHNHNAYASIEKG